MIQRKIAWGPEGILGFLIFSSAVFYPFPDARFGFGSVDVPYAAVLLVVLALWVSVKGALLPSGGAIPKSVCAATWCLLTGLLLSSVWAALNGRGVDTYLIAETAAFVLVPALLIAGLTRPADFYLSLAGFYLATLYLTGYGLFRFITENRDWVEFHYEEATRNGDAFYLIAAFCISFALLVAAVRRKLAGVVVVVLSTLAAVTALALVLSFARGAWIAGVSGAGVALWGAGEGAPQVRRFSLAPVTAVLFLAGLLTVLAPSVAEGESDALRSRIQSFTDSSIVGTSNTERAELLLATAEALPEWGWTGTGPGRFRDAMDAEEVRLEHGHNLLLTTWMELGIVGLVGIVVLIRSLAPLLATRPGLRVLRPVVASAVVGWLVDGLFETSTLSVFFWALIGLGLAIAYWDGEELEPGAEGTACVSP